MAATLFLIWSWKHRAWWAPNRMGYRNEVAYAGRYFSEDAADITVGHIPPGEEVAVLEQWAEKFGRPDAYSLDGVTR